MWLVFAILSAVFAALATTLSKIGLKGINSNFATAIRTSVILCITWGIVGSLVLQNKIDLQVNGRQMVFLVLSAVCTGCTWLCYNRALQIGETTKADSVNKMSVALVAVFSTVFLGEPMNWKMALSVIMILSGTAILMFAENDAKSTSKAGQALKYMNQ